MVKFSGNVPKSWRDWANKHADVVERVDQEDNDFEPGKLDYWVYLRPGYVRGYGEGTHAFHECSLNAVKSQWYQVQKEQ